MARPRYKPTPEQRERVAIAAGAGMSHESIAAALGIARNTLDLHFSEELTKGAAEKRMEILAAMFKTAKDGNVSAQKAYLSQTAQASPQQPEGKKAQADLDAKTAQSGTDWESLLPSARVQ